ncbi:hypothetical protein T11_14238 [Trichinella zimbabwensis]|uniref:Uncharacterized protein n=1 Tax=Trichinella zimbabwensis TaxID=268475 RepID=A0A0V1GSY2_9BILA|nr:hypothetical protein T11_14238 [Trichinella zimbabwensis]
MANDVEDTLCRFLRSAQLSLRLDESTLSGSGTLQGALRLPGVPSAMLSYIKNCKSRYLHVLPKKGEKRFFKIWTVSGSYIFRLITDSVLESFVGNCPVVVE